MKPSQAIVPFIKLLLKDRNNFLKALLAYTKEADKKMGFKKEYGEYGLPTADIDNLVDLDTEIQRYSYLDGTSRPIDIALIKAMVKSFPDCNYLEIGSWRGESLYNAAQEAKSCTSISLSEAEMIQFGISKRSAKLQRLFTKDVTNVKHVEANSLTFDFDSLGEKFDVIFIDGDHTYEGVKSDTENAFKMLRDENSVIIWHDFGGGYEGFRHEVIKAALDGCPPEKRDKIYRVSNTICGIFINKDVGAKRVPTPQEPNKTFTVGIKSEKFSTNLNL